MQHDHDERGNFDLTLEGLKLVEAVRGVAFITAEGADSCEITIGRSAACTGWEVSCMHFDSATQTICWAHTQQVPCNDPQHVPAVESVKHAIHSLIHTTSVLLNLHGRTTTIAFDLNPPVIFPPTGRFKCDPPQHVQVGLESYLGVPIDADVTAVSTSRQRDVQAVDGGPVPEDPIINVCICPMLVNVSDMTAAQTVPTLKIFTFAQNELDLIQQESTLAKQAIELVRLDDYGLCLEDDSTGSQFISLNTQDQMHLFGSMSMNLDSTRSPACSRGMSPDGRTLTGLVISIQVSSTDVTEQVVAHIAEQVEKTLSTLKQDSFPILLRSVAECERDDLIRSSAASLASLVSNLSEEAQTHANPIIAKLMAKSSLNASLEETLYDAMHANAVSSERQAKLKRDRKYALDEQVDEHNTSPDLETEMDE